MPRKLPKGKSLAEVNTELAKEWHSTKNGDLTPSDFTSGSGEKVWWKCDKGEDHEWEASVHKRSSGRSCPVCNGSKIVKSNCLSTTNPKLAKEWHPTKNGELSPSNIASKSNKKIWWKCNKGNDHEWTARVSSRSSGAGCSICSSRTVVKSNCLATTHPELAEEWHPTKNGELRPLDIIYGTHKKIWWKCDKGEDHEWYTAPSNRSTICPFCMNIKVSETNSLQTLFPHLALQWHPTKNGSLTPNQIISGSGETVWWKCEKGDDHEWETTIVARSKQKEGYGCPYCYGRYVSVTNSLKSQYPELAEEWHPTKNGSLTPDKVTPGSHKVFWWKCDKGEDHEWYTIGAIDRIKRGDGCTICSGHKVVNSNCLATTHPKLVKEWHPTKNGDLTPFDVSYGSGKVWWKCNKGDDHEWKTRVVHRTKGGGCPFCTLTPQSKQELTITFELLKFFKDINPRGFKTKINGKVRSIDIYIPQFQLAIEFDGSYWHKGKREFDKLKTIQLKEEGLDVIRVREQSKVATLKKITKNDVISKTPFNGKEVANNVLKQIMKMYELDTKKIAKFESYIAKNELQNEKGLDKYIDMILTEKAEKKK
ncbi:MAG: hypothetical protein ACI93N_001561 [Flavobacteriaceae bacterium]|jgi:hypothetical protein